MSTPTSEQTPQTTTLLSAVKRLLSPSTSRSLAGVHKFYFLDYFYILLKGASTTSNRFDAFEEFKDLKRKFWLGESKYKTKIDNTTLSPVQEHRYQYTFRQVLEEARDYHLVEERGNNIILRRRGIDLLYTYEHRGKARFNEVLASYMESRYGAFRHLINLLYSRNTVRGGLIVFPNYSPRQLGIDRKDMVTTKDFATYLVRLRLKLEEDLNSYLGIQFHLQDHTQVLVSRLTSSGILPREPGSAFDPGSYNALTKRVRDFWMNFMLKELYGYDHSLSSFDIWTYRAKQVGILQATEFYPGFSGRIVYPTSILSESKIPDFTRIYSYPDQTLLLLHKPKWEAMQDSFLHALVNAYFQLRRGNNNYYINLTALRELVCYNLKISDYTFESYLEQAYKLNLAGDLKIKISLEVDKLPEETKAAYLKQEPVTIDGRARNIIAIDVTKGSRNK